MGHIGNKSKGQFGYFKSITYTVNEQGDWNVEQLPRVFDVHLLSNSTESTINVNWFYGVQVKYEAPPVLNELTIEDIQV